MAATRRVRDNRLVDIIDGLPKVPYSRSVWRVVREGRDPVEGSAPAGRWDDGTFDVLYTSVERQGALAEVYYHLTYGLPVFPSKMQFYLYEIQVDLKLAADITPTSVIENLGVDLKSFGSLPYTRRMEEYAISQPIGEAAYFLDREGLIVPNARLDCKNLVLFTARLPPDRVAVLRNHGVIDWAGLK